MESQDDVHRSISFLEEAIKSYVPWFSVCEWNQVYYQLYSENIEDNKQALANLQVWKARSSSLPYAVECSYTFLRILMKDPDWLAKRHCFNYSQAFDEFDLTMMYCTAITRFLSQVLNVDPKKGSVESMYKLAKRLSIPQWVVNLRHDASHGTNLPHLTTLREAAHFAMNWLREKYWQMEKESSCDWTPGLESQVLVSRMSTLVDVWQSVHIYMRLGYGTAGKVPDLSIRESLFIMREEYLQSKPRSKDCNSKNWKLKYALSYIEKQIFVLIKKESDAKELLNIMIHSQGFLVDEKVLPLYLDNTPIEGDTIESLPRDLLNQWNELIGVLQSAQLIPELIEKLVEICHTKNGNTFCCKVAALWIVEVARSVLRLRSVQDVMSSYGVNLLEKSNLADYAASRLHAIKGTSSTSEMHVARLWEKASTQVDELYPELTSVIVLPIRVLAPSKPVILGLLKKACLQPNMLTLTYMPILFELVCGLLPKDNLGKLQQVVSIYLGHSDGGSRGGKRSSQVHTLAAFLRLRNSQERLQEQQLLDDDKMMPGDNPWTPSSDSGECWLSSSSGLLPWQPDLHPMDFKVQVVSDHEGLSGMELNCDQ